MSSTVSPTVEHVVCACQWYVDWTKINKALQKNDPVFRHKNIFTTLYKRSGSLSSQHPDSSALSTWVVEPFCITSLPHVASLQRPIWTPQTQWVPTRYYRFLGKVFFFLLSCNVNISAKILFMIKLWSFLKNLAKISKISFRSSFFCKFSLSFFLAPHGSYACPHRHSRLRRWHAVDHLILCLVHQWRGWRQHSSWKIIWQLSHLNVKRIKLHLWNTCFFISLLDQSIAYEKCHEMGTNKWKLIFLNCFKFAAQWLSISLAKLAHNSEMFCGIKLQI